jgi:hypothetical protein
MNWDLIEILMILWLIERVSVERNRYKIAIDTDGQFIGKGYWSIWIYHKGINETHWGRYGGVRLIYFRNYVIPIIKL